MKIFILLFVILTQLGCTESNATVATPEREIPTLHFPNTVMECTVTGFGTLQMSMTNDLQLVGTTYYKMYILEDVKVICQRLASTEIANDRPVTEKNTWHYLDKVDIYLVQVQIPNEQLITKTIIFNGDTQDVLSEEKVTIVLKNGS